MNLSALQHVIRSAQALAEDKTIIVLGSASLLASFPSLGSPTDPLASTFDADILPDPFDELTAEMLHEALGENRAYYRIHGYHADVLRDSIRGTLPTGWLERLVPIPEMTSAFALDPYDLAAVKILVARPKDLDLIRYLNGKSLLESALIEERIHKLPIPVESLPRVLANFRITLSTRNS